MKKTGDTRILLIRHGESQQNAGIASSLDIGDAYIPLTEKGCQQARAVGEELGATKFESSLVYCSPYLRTRQTLEGALEGAGVDKDSIRILEDPRLREVDFGYTDWESQQSLREKHGWFYYRFKGGESPADCYDRTSSFLESMMRQLERKSPKTVLVFTHGLTIRCFVMRFLHLSVEDFEELENPDNCDVVTLSRHMNSTSTVKWTVAGLRRRH